MLEANAEGLVSYGWSRDESILENVKRLYVGHYVTELYKRTSQITLEKIRACVITGEPQEWSFRGSDALDSNVPVAMRIIPCFYDRDLVLMIINYPHFNEEQIIEDTWKQAVEAAGDGIWDANMRMGKIYFSAGWKKMLGYDDHELGTELAEVINLMHPDDVDSFNSTLSAYFKGDLSVLSHEHRVRCKDGNYKWLLTRGRLLSRTDEGKPARVIGVETDITAIKSVQEKLQLINETFHSAFHYSSVGNALVSPDGKWLEVNRAVTRMLGYSKEELLSKTFQDITYPEDLEKDLALVNQMLRGEIDTYSLEKRYVSKDHRIVWALLKVSLVRNIDASPKFFISQIVNITRERELRQELEKQRDQLEVTAEGLQEKLSRLEELNYMIAHNLRGPVGNINMIVKSVRDEDGLFSLQESLDHIISSSDALMESLDTLMEFSKIKLHDSIPFDDCSISQIFEKVKTHLHSTIFQKQAELTLNFDTDEISYPRQYLESILYNLLSNALKYSKRGETPRVLIDLRFVDSVPVLTVNDNGIGIDLVRHGNKLFKLNGILHQGYDSKGLGLFLTKTQVEALGGNIQVNSTPGEGTSFRVELHSREYLAGR
ncbi:MAG: PAS domain S-box protein [Chitinophagaceae bacterium]|nr:MAG: PAS domain S-box protein [Chitinophagaceae bacterium]